MIQSHPRTLENTVLLQKYNEEHACRKVKLNKLSQRLEELTCNTVNFSVLQNGQLLFSGAIQNCDLEPEDKKTNNEKEFFTEGQALVLF